MTRWVKTQEALSQLLCVLLVNGDADEMLSSYAWRTQNKTLIGWLDWLLGSGHCRESYEWERANYRVGRFENAQ